MYLDKKCRLVHYIPHKVKDNFRRNPTQMLNYFKQIGGNEGKLGGFSGGFSDNIHKLVEQIEFLSCNLQHYDYIINKCENYYLLESLHSLNLIDKLLNSELELGCKFWQSICKNKHCIHIISKNIDKLDSESWYNLSCMDKELEIIKKYSKICIDNIISLYFGRKDKYIEQKKYFDVGNFWKFQGILREILGNLGKVSNFRWEARTLCPHNMAFTVGPKLIRPHLDPFVGA